MTASRTRRLRKRGPADPKGLEYLAAFSVLWCRLLWDAMAKSGKGFPRPKVQRKARRGDKIGSVNRKALRGVAVRGLVAGHVPMRPWVTQMSRVRGDSIRLANKARRLGFTPTWEKGKSDV